MRKYIYILCLLALCFNKAFSQFIVAGTPGPKYHDIIPDTTVQSGGNVDIDINIDGISDLRFVSYYLMWPPGTVSSCYVGALNSSTRFIDDHSDNCFITYNSSSYTHNVPHQFSSGDTIRSASLATTEYFSEHRYEYATTCDNPEWKNQGDKYLGVQYHDTTGTYYGWVRVNVSDYNLITIKEFSLNQPLSAQGIQVIKDSGLRLEIFPNPVSNLLYLHANDNQLNGANIEITDALGQIMLRQPYSNSVNVSSLATGVYTVRILANGESLSRAKFIKE